MTTHIITVAKQGNPGPREAVVVTTVTGSAPITATPAGAASYNVALGAGFTAVLVVPTIAALSATPAALFVQATPAIVQSVGADWSYEPAGMLAVDGITVATASGGGQWWRGATRIAAQALSQLVWIVSPATGSDESAGGVGSPVKSYAEIARRWGTCSPDLPINPTIQWLDDGVLSDAVLCTPARGAVTLLGTLILVGAPLVIGSFTPKVKATATIATINCVGQTWTVGSLVRDTTANASFFIFADLGGGTAQITEPMAVPLVSLARATPVPGDTIQVCRPTKLYVDQIDGTVNYPLLMTNFTYTGVAAGLGIAVAVIGDNVIVNESIQDSTFAITLAKSLGGSEGPSFNGVWATAGPFGTGPYIGRVVLKAGAIAPTAGVCSFHSQTYLDYDVLLAVRAHLTADLYVGSAYVAQGFDFNPSQSNTKIILTPSPGASIPTLWGPHVLIPSGGQQVVIRSSSATASLLGTGAKTIDGSATAFPWTTALAAYGAAVPITNANIDSLGGLSNPATGTRIIANQ
jgi:hypothetical protein